MTSSPATNGSKPRIAIALGDPGGIGAEVALKAALDPGARSICRPLLFGDRPAALGQPDALIEAIRRVAGAAVRS